MSRPRKCLERSEVGEQENMDRISSLPDELLGHVLSFLPTKHAVGTSILSSRWKCLHMFTNSLSFEVPLEFRENKIKARKKRFKNFVNRVLLLHRVSPIKKFTLNCGLHTYDASLLNAWISAAIFKGVERFHLFQISQLNALLRSLFSSHTIVELEICCKINGFRVPESIHLPSLKILHLKSMEFSNTDSVGKLCSGCPLLQELKMNSCKWPTDSECHASLSCSTLKCLLMTYCKGRVVVNAPNLTYLRYACNGVDIALSLKNSDILVTANLGLWFTDNSDSARLALMLMKTVCHVKELYLRREAVQYLTRSEGDHIPSYPYLVKLYIGRCSYDTWRYVTYWLANSPLLETLIFEEGFFTKKWPPNPALVRFSSHVKVIGVSMFDGSNTELDLLKYLLINAEVLEELIRYAPYLGSKKELVTSRKLLMLPRTSRACVVQLRKETYPANRSYVSN